MLLCLKTVLVISEGIGYTLNLEDINVQKVNKELSKVLYLQSSFIGYRP